ncbi:protoheme IX farnesyltransferase, mitochondrial [Anopheles moucheti]|uniref:protoheme IX farnesyltransferase, mitochondrial n=1 Tax=Anopheles moucheti TaxID=186751 RepID=UPI0022F11C5F|nr:protoheme IX farnesyltransferase, mitochondrial [Anopheles moucheti]
MHKFLANGRLWCDLVRQTGPRTSGRPPFVFCTRLDNTGTTSCTAHLYAIRKRHSGSNETESTQFSDGASKTSPLHRPLAVPLAVPLSVVPPVVDAKALVSEISQSVGLPTGSTLRNEGKFISEDGTKEPVVASVTSLPGLSRLIYHYLMLSKIRLTSLVVMTAMAGYAMAPGSFELGTFLLCSAGTTLVSGAANSINQVIETSFDAQMARTRNRVLVKGYLSRLHAVGFALGASTVGCSMLYFGVNEMTAALGAANLILYTSIYTPMKRYSILNTWVGSFVGAIPPLMGWAACTGGDLGAGAWILAGLLYCWQFPHFNALSWNIRPEYLKAGYKMMANSHPALCTRVSLRHTGFIAGLSLLAPILDVTSVWFALETLPLNAYFAYLAWDFHQKADSKSSRKLFRFSLLHLPLLMALFLLNKKHWLFRENNKSEMVELESGLGAGAMVTDVFVGSGEKENESEYLVPNIVADIGTSAPSSGSIKAIEDSLLSNVATVLPTAGKQKL